MESLIVFIVGICIGTAVAATFLTVAFISDARYADKLNKENIQTAYENGYRKGRGALEGILAEICEELDEMETKVAEIKGDNV